jgi:hypothetical protein
MTTVLILQHNLEGTSELAPQSLECWWLPFTTETPGLEKKPHEPKKTTVHTTSSPTLAVCPQTGCLTNLSLTSSAAEEKSKQYLPSTT